MTLTLFPRLYQSKRQIDRYNLDIDAQAILVASRLMAAGAKLGHAVEIHFSRFGLSIGRYRFLADLEDNDGEELPSQLAENLEVTRRSHFTALLRSFLRQNDRSLTDIVTSKRSPIFTDRLFNLMAEIISAHQEKKEG
ncbi:hypothetical protein PAECIP111894_03552 [Paenibacillus pseudetheri]|uniref:Uncharacterized protein n=1 Tax=Paenibacillus pseudetheri TaxID=2897682 RepID=A0ABN8FPF1_9BACL|nr:hypothetical protein PAECIP111894_03552 [Paenibacillus pseudetheri]